MHWKQKVINLTPLLSLVPLLVVVMTTYGATNDDKILKLTIFLFSVWFSMDGQVYGISPWKTMLLGLLNLNSFQQKTDALYITNLGLKHYFVGMLN